MGVFGEIKSKILNVAGIQINPATDEKIDNLITAVGKLVSVKLYDAGNSTETSLGVSGNFPGAWIDTSEYSQAVISLITDEDAAVDGLKIESSVDGVSTLHYHSFSPLANVPAGHHFVTTLDNQYLRVSYTNGATAQGVFKLSTTLFKNTPEESHVHGLEYIIGADHQASVSRSVLVAKDPSGDYDNITRTTGGSLKISLEEMEPQVSEDIKLYPTGAGVNGSVTLTAAATPYAVPPVAPTGSYRIVIENTSDSVVYVGYQDANTDGIKVEPGELIKDNLGAGEQLFVYCASAGKGLTYTTKEVN